MRQHFLFDPVKYKVSIYPSKPANLGEVERLKKHWSEKIMVMVISWSLKTNGLTFRALDQCIV